MSNERDAEIILKFLRDLYVDDETTTVRSVDEGVEFYNKMKKYMADGSFNVRKWDSNNAKLREIIREKEVSPAVDDVTYSEEVLGVSEKYRKVDEFIFELSTIGAKGLKLKYTKRNMLRISASFYDPSGFVCPVALQSKLLFKELCSQKVDWDALIENEL